MKIIIPIVLSLASQALAQDFSKGSVKWHMSPVKDQGDRDTCSVFTAVALIESQPEYRGYDFSEQCLAYYSSHKDPGISTQRLDFIANEGLVQESLCPYNGNDRDDVPYQPIVHNPIPIEWEAWHANTIDHRNVRARIMFYKPVAVSVYVAGDWRVDIIDAPTDKEIKDECGSLSECAGHAVVIVGYDDNEQAFEFKNSWGIGWGDDGYGKMSYKYFDKMKKNYVISRKN